LQRTGSDKPWAFLPLQLGTVLEDLYSMTVVTEIGDGTNTLFWEDRWIASQRIRDIALAMVNMVPKKWIKKKNSTRSFTKRVLDPRYSWSGFDTTDLGVPKSVGLIWFYLASRSA
jgi:hypothetical protein